MKILLISPQQKQANGGIAVWTEMFLNACEGADIEPTLVNIAMVGKRLENGTAKRNMLDELKRTRAIFKSLKGALRADTFEVAHINTSCASFGIMRDYFIAKKIRKKQPNAKIAVHYHCDIPVQIKKKSAFKYLSRLSRLADINFVLCDTSAQYLKKNFGVESVKLPNFVDEGAIRTEPKKISEKIEKAFFVGRVQTAKGAKEIYELAKRLHDITFELAGAPSALVEGWEKPENVTLLGPLPHSEVLAKMDEADVFIFPTHTEGFSLALAEAMARGLPVITTSVGANADMLEGGCGELVEVGDVDGMVAALERMCAPEYRAAMSEKSANKVRNQYVTEAVMAKIKNEYRV